MYVRTLGCNVGRVATKSRAVVLPFSRYASTYLDRSVMEDASHRGDIDIGMDRNSNGHSGLFPPTVPVNALAGMNVLLRISRLGVIGMILAATVIVWCTVSSTRLFEMGCGLRDQRYLVRGVSRCPYLLCQFGWFQASGRRFTGLCGRGGERRVPLIE